MTNYNIKFIFVLSLSLIAFFMTSAQKNYYVSPSGSDAGSGTLSTPWKTVYKGCNAISSGDTLNIMAGTYNEMVPLYKGGDSSKGSITVRNYGQDTVILDGSGLSGRGLMTIYNVSYINIKGLILQNSIKNDAIGFLVEGNCRNISFENNVVRQIYFSANAGDAVSSGKNSHPILVNGTNASNPVTNLKIINNRVYNCRTGYSEALTLNGNVDGFLVQGNNVHDITNIGIDIAGNYGICSNAANDQARNGSVIGNLVYNCKSPVAAAAGIYVDGGRDVFIERNEVHDCQWGMEVGSEVKGKTTSGIYVRDNIIYHNALSGLTLGGYDYPSTGKVINSVLANNTTFNNDSTGEGGGELDLSYSENCIITNNIFYNGFKNLLAFLFYQSTYVPVKLSLDYNLWFTTDAAGPQFAWGKQHYSDFASYQSATGNDFHSLQVDPQFKNLSTTAPDLMLQSISAAIDHGDPSFVLGVGELDKSGSSRIKNGRVDIGAFEYQNGTTGLNLDTRSNNRTAFYLGNNYPNPFNPATMIHYTMTAPAKVMLDVYNIYGKEIAHLVNGYKIPGDYEVEFNAGSLPSGIYLYRLQSGTFTATKKMSYLK